MIIRVAKSADSISIAAVYNDAVLNSVAVWNETPVTPQNRADWMAARQADGFPVLVVEDSQGEVVGFASYGPFRAFDGFRLTVEHSVYVRADQRGRGMGRALLQALIEYARKQGIHVMVAGIAAENEGSIRLHQHLGFKTVGLLPQVGVKFGRWLDLAFLQLQLDEGPAPKRE
ncbi:phosphinothricin acetyltransferase [Ketogulonicigenium robustum]|uniref:Phosphinothricin acetyltransferase n=1 Tax=Ketogulonicigenium robustum TaxID=92947 RepID=A0A1W6NWX1_9RHOB|nr:GNAT family N-acetyltransferase [Ketogulonicigenium robustum]ARO13610.1 phosphinothricin acetyltransferase [Ketogulonicigenium robustum]